MAFKKSLIEDKWKKLPKEDNFLGIPISELEPLSCVPIYVIRDSECACTGGGTEGNEVYLNNGLNIDCIKRNVTRRLSKCKNSVELLRKLSDVFKSYRKIAYFFVLHEVAHIRLKHTSHIICATSQHDEEYMHKLMEKIVCEQGNYKDAIEAEADCWSLNELEKYVIIERLTY